MDNVEAILKDLINAKIDYLKIKENKEEIIDYLDGCKLLPQATSNEICFLSGKIFNDCLLASIIDHKEAFPTSLMPFKIANETKMDECFGDLTLEIFPIFVYLLFNGDYDSIEKVLKNKSRLIHKGGLFEAYVSICIDNNNIPRLKKFIEKNKDKGLFESFNEDILSTLSRIDMSQAFEYLNKCEEDYSIDYRCYGYPFEIRNMFLHNVSLEDSTDYSLNMMLGKLKQHFRFEIINYNFIPYKDKDKEYLYYKEEEKVEKELLKIVKKHIGYEFDEDVIKEIQSNNMIMSFFYKSPDLIEDLSTLEQLLAVKKTIEIHLSHKFLDTKNEDFFIYFCDEFSQYINEYYEGLDFSSEEESSFDKITNRLFKSEDLHDVCYEYED